MMVGGGGDDDDDDNYRYRGLMMDYSRHFYPVSFIEHTIDAMATSKLNVLHMHMFVPASLVACSICFACVRACVRACA